VIDIDPDWQSGELQNYINSVDIGYEPGHTVVAMTENSQLGGTGKVRRYEFTGNIPSSGTASWYSEPFGYGSGIVLNDFDQDGLLDLIYGGWWLPVKIAFGTETGFETEPSYTSSTNSVVETILLGDLGREDEWYVGESILIEPAQAGTNVLVLSPEMIDRVVNVYKNGVTLSPSEYTHIHGKSWIAFRTPFQDDDFIEVGCIFSPFPDMVITNWDSNKGNYIFYNTEGGLGYEENNSSGKNCMISPNPASNDFQIKLPAAKSYTHIMVTDLQGRIMKTEEVHQADPFITVNSKAWPAGIYFVIILQDGESWSGKLIIK
jgi:hypothetical protein